MHDCSLIQFKLIHFKTMVEFSSYYYVLKTLFWWYKYRKIFNRNRCNICNLFVLKLSKTTNIYMNILTDNNIIGWFQSLGELTPYEL